MKAQDIINNIKEVTSSMSQQEQADFIWSIITETSLKDATMNRVDGGYEIVLEMNEEGEHDDDGSGDYLCDCCNEPVNTQDWCFSCKDYVYVHHIND